MPDELFDRATRAAKAHGLSRSQLYALAVDKYVSELEGRELTARIDALIDATGDPRDAAVVEHTMRRLGEDDDW